MIRMMLSDAQWDRIEPLLLGKAGDPGRSGTDNRLFLEAVLWLVRTGVPWRDLPEAFGRWNTVFRRFRRWACKGVFESIFTALSGDPDFEYALVDGTIVRVHQHGAGAKGGTHTQAIGRSRGGMTTKIVALVDALGNLARFVLLPGQRHDSVGVEPLIDGRHPAQGRPRPPDRLRLRDLSLAPPGRELLLQSQGVPSHRHPL